MTGTQDKGLKLCFLVCLFVCLFDLTVYITPNILYLVLGDLEQPPLQTKKEGGKPRQNGVSDSKGRMGLEGEGMISSVFWVGNQEVWGISFSEFVGLEARSHGGGEGGQADSEHCPGRQEERS